MALKTLHIVQCLSRTPLLFIPRYLTNIHFKLILGKQKINKKNTGHLKDWKRRAPENDRDLSSQKCFNFRGVLIGDKTDCKTHT